VANSAIVRGARGREPPMARLNLRLLGGFQVRLGDGPALTLPAKAQALLAYVFSSSWESSGWPCPRSRSRRRDSSPVRWAG
jgi:hypothetical protein